MEITREITVSIDEQSLIDMHSVLNVFNVILYELLTLSDHLGGSEAIDELHDTIVDTADNLRDPEEGYRQVENVDAMIRTIRGVVASEAQRVDRVNDEPVQAIQANLESIFAILRVRAEEIVARHANPDAWVTYDVAFLKHNFLNVLHAIEQNSKGGYRIVYNIAEHEGGDYFVAFDITSEDKKTIRMPSVFQDVMRDLLANARKYTPPGGRITAGLTAHNGELRYVVADTGIGIPPEEIESIVEFGARGSNVAGRPTRGGGFGLTKAYYVTRHFGGRMWIDSPAEGAIGTRIEIRIPLPADSETGADG